MKRLLLAGAAASALLPTVANAAPAPTRTIGHDGNWTIDLWHESFCSMTAPSTDNTHSIVIAVYNTGVASVFASLHLRQQIPDKLLVTITDQKGQLVTNKTFLKQADSSYAAAALSTTDMITLFGLSAISAFPDHQIVHIDASLPEHPRLRRGGELSHGTAAMANRPQSAGARHRSAGFAAATGSPAASAGPCSAGHDRQ